MLIYKCTNNITGRCYIGQTSKTLKKRISVHLTAVKYGSILYFHRSLRKYGIDNFTWKILKECYSKKKLNEYEIFYINEYNSLSPKGYNLTGGGDNIWLNASDEMRDKHKKNLLKNSWKWSGNKNGMKNPDTINKHLKSMRNEERCEKHSNWMKSNNPNNDINVIRKKCKYKFTILSPDSIIYNVENLKDFCRKHKLGYKGMCYMLNESKKKKYKEWKLIEMS